MKFLTIRQPWASLIAVGAKHIETRPFSTKYRGPLAIHAGKKQLHHGVFFMKAREALNEGLITAEQEAPFRCFDVPFGAVVAVCDLVDVVPIRTPFERDEDGGWVGEGAWDPAVVVRDAERDPLYLHNGDPFGVGGLDITNQRFLGDFTPGRFAWILDNVRPIDPVPMKGAQGLRDLPEGVVIP